MNEKKAYEKKLQARYDEWSAQIDKLKAKSEQVEANAQLEYTRQVKELRAMQKAAGERLSELKGASDDAWKDLKAGVDTAWDSLGNALRSAQARF
jgi:predicted RNase H-like nuclease (RuvC/YqgF family)